MKKGKSTIHDIARKLNITASTVSRALNDNPRISEATKKAVQQAARKLNYQPNHIAAALRNGRSNILGIIVPTIDRGFFSSVVRGIEEIANNSRYNVMICQSNDNYEKEVATVEALLSARVDGIIASYAKETTDFTHFLKAKEKGIPVILFDRSNSALEVSHVLIDDYLGAYKATEHLINQGCKHIAHFTNTRKISIYKERLRGYKEALQANGMVFDESMVVESNLQLADGKTSMEKLFKAKKKPDAIFSASDYSAMGALQYLKEKGIDVPNEIKIVGFSNEAFTHLTEPTLSTVEQHSLRIGNAAAEIFLEEVKSGDKKFIPQTVVLKPELIVRESSVSGVSVNPMSPIKSIKKPHVSTE
ncbi:LacI family transcriptional regulator [Chryseotalea sanaruensis]|uniref:LacI family transcriptional regulator n=1 Tax=Chryseotalea sanaruensis TaxID=2482724 RepID=A0A401U5B8_9BACT|nr:LacI family DNA-binding transcriptional regulator [Chryseotalea sanaruensis]GCC50065.1 LacI family transcriptional regulator [Chryseotalea sanaruensis]